MADDKKKGGGYGAWRNPRDRKTELDRQTEDILRDDRKVKGGNPGGPARGGGMTNTTDILRGGRRRGN